MVYCPVDHMGDDHVATSRRHVRYLKGDVFTGSFDKNLKTGLGRIT